MAKVEPRELHLSWNGVEWMDDRCGCRYHPDDPNGSHGGAPHVHRCKQHAKLADMLPEVPRRCSESYMAVTVPDFKPMLCPECHQTVGVEDDGRGHGQLIAHDVDGEPWRDAHA